MFIPGNVQSKLPLIEVFINYYRLEPVFYHVLRLDPPIPMYVIQNVSESDTDALLRRHYPPKEKPWSQRWLSNINSLRQRPRVEETTDPTPPNRTAFLKSTVRAIVLTVAHPTSQITAAD